jgi:hypothetical protein
MCEGKKMWYAGLEDKHSLLPGRQTCHARPGRGAGIDQNFVTISFQKKNRFRGVRNQIKDVVRIE